MESMCSIREKMSRWISVGKVVKVTLVGNDVEGVARADGEEMLMGESGIVKCCC